MLNAKTNWICSYALRVSSRKVRYTVPWHTRKKTTKYIYMYSKTDVITSVLRQRNYYDKKINKGAFQN